MATTIEKTKLPSPKQTEVLNALSAGRLVKVEDTTRGRKVALVTPSGKPVKDAPRLDADAVEACRRYGWVGENGQVTSNGVLARKAAQKALKTK